MSIPILSIKDALGRWIKIVSIKGDKGDPGANGRVQDVKVNGTSVVGSDGVANIQQSGGGGSVNDVKLNGVSCVTDGVANVPLANNAGDGIVHGDNSRGTNILSNGAVAVYPASDTNINNRNSDYRPIAPSKLDLAVKAALCDGRGAAYTDAEKAAARLRLGIDAYVEAKIREILGSAKWKVTWRDSLDFTFEIGDDEYIDLTGQTINVSFKSNGTNFNSISVADPPEDMSYGNTVVYNYATSFATGYKECIFASDPRGLFLGDWAYFLNTNALSIEQIYE